MLKNAAFALILLSALSASAVRAAEPKLKVLESYLTEGPTLDKLKRKSDKTVKAGEEFYLYYKVDGYSITKEKGGRAKLELAVKKGSKVVGRMPDLRADTDPKPNAKGDISTTYASVVHFKLDKGTAPGYYIVSVTFKDENSGQSSEIRYTVNLQK